MSKFWKKREKSWHRKRLCLEMLNSWKRRLEVVFWMKFLIKTSALFQRKAAVRMIKMKLVLMNERGQKLRELKYITFMERISCLIILLQYEPQGWKDYSHILFILTFGTRSLRFGDAQKWGFWVMGFLKENWETYSLWVGSLSIGLWSTDQSLEFYIVTNGGWIESSFIGSLWGLWVTVQSKWLTAYLQIIPPNRLQSIKRYLWLIQHMPPIRLICICIHGRERVEELELEREALHFHTVLLREVGARSPRSKPCVSSSVPDCQISSTSLNTWLCTGCPLNRT